MTDVVVSSVVTLVTSGVVVLEAVLSAIVGDKKMLNIGCDPFVVVLRKSDC